MITLAIFIMCIGTALVIGAGVLLFGGTAALVMVLDVAVGIGILCLMILFIKWFFGIFRG